MEGIWLPDLIPLLPKYTRACAYGGVGDVKTTVRFIYHEPHLFNYSYCDLTEDLIQHTWVTAIYPSATAYRGHASEHLILECEERR